MDQFFILELHVGCPSITQHFDNHKVYTLYTLTSENPLDFLLATHEHIILKSSQNVDMLHGSS